MRDIRVAEVADTVRGARENAEGCCLLIGAGCSVTAGIPTAAGLVERFADKWKTHYEDVEQKTWPSCMARLAPIERQRFVAPIIDAAKVNWAHIAIAHLMKCGYITRILTTNFDPLLVQACSMVGVFPAVYDLAASKIFNPAQVRDPSIFYLHGQRLGFVMLSTEKEVTDHGQTLAPVFQRAGEERVWIVAGYSGLNDPVFEHLARVDSFGYHLYWVGYRDEAPPKHVSERLLSEERFAHYVRGHDADSFFLDLTRELECFPPDLVVKPFTHLKAVTQHLMPLSYGGINDLRDTLLQKIEAAIERFEHSGDTLETMSHVFAGDYERVVAAFQASPDPSPQLRDAAAWACVEEGKKIGRRARSARGDAGPLWESAREKYRLALEIKPDMVRALNSWAISLIEHAMALPPEQREPLFAEAEEKCRRRDELQPGGGAYNLACLASLRGDAEQCRLSLQRAKDKGFLPKPVNILTDPDLESVRHLPWFIELANGGDAIAPADEPTLPVKERADAATPLVADAPVTAPVSEEPLLRSEESDVSS